MKLDGVGWNWMELAGGAIIIKISTCSDSYDIISSLLEKDDIIRAHFFKNKKTNYLIRVYELSIT